MTTNQLNDDDGALLIALARNTLEVKLTGSAEPMDTGKMIHTHPGLKRHAGTFVTLTRNGQLRGCIGNLTATESIAQGVRDNVLNAAFHDHRFKPLTRTELGEIHIEVSILSEPSPLSFRDGDDLISKLRPHVDGVILRKGPNGATFLPQVWEQLPEAMDFLTHLCRKAGLPGDAWTRPGIEISTYQVQYFEEE